MMGDLSRSPISFRTFHFIRMERNKSTISKNDKMICRENVTYINAAKNIILSPVLFSEYMFNIIAIYANSIAEIIEEKKNRKLN